MSINVIYYVHRLVGGWMSINVIYYVHRLVGGWMSINVIYYVHRLVGGFGLGPKYLVDEYAVLDARYWVLGDSMVAWVCYQEFFIMLPLELVWYVALQRRHWSRHYWAVITGTAPLQARAQSRPVWIMLA